METCYKLHEIMWVGTFGRRRFGDAVLATPFWHRRFGDAPFWRRTLWRRGLAPDNFFFSVQTYPKRDGS